MYPTESHEIFRQRQTIPRANRTFFLRIDVGGLHDVLQVGKMLFVHHHGFFKAQGIDTRSALYAGGGFSGNHRRIESRGNRNQRYASGGGIEIPRCRRLRQIFADAGMHQTAFVQRFQRFQQSFIGKIHDVIVVAVGHVKPERLHIPEDGRRCAQIGAAAELRCKALALIVQCGFQIEKTRVALLDNRAEFLITGIIGGNTALNQRVTDSGKFHDNSFFRLVFG